MNHISSPQAVLVWLLLVSATIGASWLAERVMFAPVDIAILIMGLALIKGYAIVRYYMDMKLAPLPWHLAFVLWLLIVTLVIVVPALFVN